MSRHVITSASGRGVDLDAPDPGEIVLDDIAGGLSRVCRFGAQAQRFHSVAEHAVLVARLVVDGGRPELGLAALHHDSHEAYVCDLPSPLKRKLRTGKDDVYDRVCAALDAAIFAALRIAAPSAAESAVIKAADDRALMLEAAELLPDGGRALAAERGLAVADPGALGGDSLAPDRARQQFMHIHEHLLRARADGLPRTSSARYRPPAV